MNSGRPYQVKGSTIRSKFDYIHEHFGEKERAALEERFADRGLLPILVSGWYDYDLYIEVLEAIALVHFGGDLSALRRIGAYSAKQSLRTVYAAFVRQAGFAEFLKGISRLHHMFYNIGEIVVDIDAKARRVLIRHENMPRIAEVDLHVAAGFYAQAAEIHETSSASCEFERTEDGEALFTVQW